MAKEGIEKFVWSDFLTKYSKTILLTSLLVSALALTVLGGFWYYDTLKNKDVVAVVNGEKVTKEAVNKNAEYNKKFFEYSQNTAALDSAFETAKVSEIDNTIVRTEAAKRGLTASPEETTDYLKTSGEQYDTREIFLATMEYAYGWDLAAVEQNAKMAILKSKLEDQVLSQRSGRLLYFRYDMLGAKPADMVKTEAQAKVAKADLESGKKFDDIYASYQIIPEWTKPYSGKFSFENINETGHDIFKGEKDWEAIKDLNKVGDISAVYKSEGGYYAVAQLEAITNGQYDNWANFSDSILGVKKTAFNISTMLPGQKAYAALTTGAACETINGLKTAGTYCTWSCPTCQVSAQAAFRGLVRSGNSGGPGIVGARVVITFDDDRNFNLTPTVLDQLRAMKADVTTVQANTYKTVTSPSVGTATGNKNGYYGTSNVFNCSVDWQGTASKDGYISQTITDKDAFNDGITELHFVLAPTPPPAYAVSYNGNGNTAGKAPVDSSSPYVVGLNVNLLGNTGGLTKDNYDLVGWNTNCSDSTTCVGTAYHADGTEYFKMPSQPLTFYAQWKLRDTPPPVNTVTPTLSCSTTPQTGLSPLVVKVSPVVINPEAGKTYKFNYVMEPGITLPDRPSPLYYTYATTGTKNITVSTTPLTSTCTASVTVTNPSDGSGGEVNPN